jgi:hypothetical protein
VNSLDIEEVFAIKITVSVSIINLFLAYFPKMKVGLSNHQSVCPPLITFEPLGRFS